MDKPRSGWNQYAELPTQIGQMGKFFFEMGEKGGGRVKNTKTKVKFCFIFTFIMEPVIRAPSPTAPALRRTSNPPGEANPALN